jgi:hypothetical protein
MQSTSMIVFLGLAKKRPLPEMTSGIALRAKLTRMLKRRWKYIEAQSS